MQNQFCCRRLAVWDISHTRSHISGIYSLFCPLDAHSGFLTSVLHPRCNSTPPPVDFNQWQESQIFAWGLRGSTVGFSRAPLLIQRNNLFTRIIGAHIQQKLSCSLLLPCDNQKVSAHSASDLEPRTCISQRSLKGFFLQQEAKPVFPITLQLLTFPVQGTPKKLISQSHSGTTSTQVLLNTGGSILRWIHLVRLEWFASSLCVTCPQKFDTAFMPPWWAAQIYQIRLNGQIMKSTSQSSVGTIISSEFNNGFR